VSTLSVKVRVSFNAWLDGRESFMRDSAPLLGSPLVEPELIAVGFGVAEAGKLFDDLETAVLHRSVDGSPFDELVSEPRSTRRLI